MNREHFIACLMRFMSKEEATRLAANYKNNEILQDGAKIIDELQEDFRLSANEKFYFGY